MLFSFLSYPQNYLLFQSFTLLIMSVKLLSLIMKPHRRYLCASTYKDSNNFLTPC